MKSERGSELIEFIGMFPLVLLGLTIAIQFMFVVYTDVMITAAVYTGARVAAVEGCSPAVEEAIETVLGTLEVEAGSYSCSGGETMTVHAATEVQGIPMPFDIHKKIDYPVRGATTIVRYEGGVRP